MHVVIQGKGKFNLPVLFILESVSRVEGTGALKCVCLDYDAGLLFMNYATMTF